MRGDERVQDGMFSYVTLEQRVPQDHPLREIRRLTDVVLRSLSAEFEQMYSASGRPSIAPEYGLIAAAMATQADGYAEREAALLMLQEKQKGNTQRITVGADKAYDTKDFVTAARALNVTAHVTKNEKGRRSNLDRRTTRHPGYAISLSRRWLVEKGFGWLKQTGPVRQVKLRGLHKVDWIFVFSCAVHNLMRLPRLIAHQALEGLQQQCV